MMAIQPKEQMNELVGEDPAERRTERFLVDRRNVDGVPVARDRSRHLALPERNPARADVGMTEPVVVPVPPASRDDGLARPIEDDDHHRRIGERRFGGDAEIQPDPTRLEEPFRLRKRSLEDEPRKRRADVDGNVGDALVR
jgi:hypothetical protein